MSNQSEDGWYPECLNCGCGNLGSDVICEECYEKKIIGITNEIYKCKSLKEIFGTLEIIKSRLNNTLVSKEVVE